MHRKLFLALLGCVCLVALGGLTSCGGGAAPTRRAPLATPTPVGLETPAAGTIYLGAYVNVSDSPQDITNLEAQVGRKLAIDMHYYGWTANFPGNAEYADLANGRLPMESWNCELASAQIVSGVGDMLITTRALAVKNFAHPVFIRYLWEMNEPASVLQRGRCYDPTTDNPDGTFSSAEFVLAWQHIRQIFAQEGVTNAIWVWNPAATGGDPTPYYPGASQVDWVGVDAYDTTGVGFTQTFASIYGTVASLQKPILIAETGETVANQPTFFASAVPALQSQFPLVKGFMYYDAKAATQDWRLSPGGLSAFATLGGNAYVSAFGSL